jgi:ketosteroid isomerase-like protein
MGYIAGVRGTRGNREDEKGRSMNMNIKTTLLKVGLTLAILLTIAVTSSNAAPADDRNAVAALDTQYQAAVKSNDAAAMDRILAGDFALVTGAGKTYTKADLLAEARSREVVYEHQEDSAQTVRLWGNTAVVTAKLWAKGTNNAKAFEYTVWFSDTYVRTAAGWRYVFGQSSLPLPKTPDR